MAVTLASVANAIRSHRLEWLPPQDAVYRSPTPEHLQSAIERDDVWLVVEQGLLVIDARKAERFEQGRIPGSLNLPAESANDRIDSVFERAAPEDTIVLYCGGDECDESRVAFDLLKEMGFVNLRIYFGGWRDWLAHDMPVEP